MGTTTPAGRWPGGGAVAGSGTSVRAAAGWLPPPVTALALAAPVAPQPDSAAAPGTITATASRIRLPRQVLGTAGAYRPAGLAGRPRGNR